MMLGAPESYLPRKIPPPILILVDPAPETVFCYDFLRRREMDGVGLDCVCRSEINGFLFFVNAEGVFKLRCPGRFIEKTNRYLFGREGSEFGSNVSVSVCLVLGALPELLFENSLELRIRYASDANINQTAIHDEDCNISLTAWMHCS